MNHMNSIEYTAYLAWLYKLATEEYKGDINLLLLELNATGRHKWWLFVNENNEVIRLT